jgi:hypothetical protein
MKRTSLLLVIFLLGSTSTVRAADAASTRTRAPAPVSPEVQLDRQVTFRLLAPKAGEVVVAGQWPNGRVPLTNPAATNRQLRLLWIACGRDDFLLKRVEEFVGFVQEKGVRHEWILTDGGHSWPIWRRYLADLAPLLFNP